MDRSAVLKFLFTNDRANKIVRLCRPVIQKASSA